ncbi:MAG: Zn-ribbon domain-containing OB-fold protein [Moorellales bacterium]
MIGIPFLQDKYAATMDLYSQQSKEFNRNYKFYEHLREGRLTTTRCRSCGQRMLPPRVMCPYCTSTDLEWVDLPTRGKVLVFVEQFVGVPLGFDTPHILAIIDLQGEAKLVSRIINCKAGELNEGDEVRMVVFPLPAVPVETRNGIEMKERVFYAFEPVR